MLSRSGQLILELVLLVLVKVGLGVEDLVHVHELDEVKVHAVRQCFLHELRISIGAFVEDLVGQELRSKRLLGQLEEGHMPDGLALLVCRVKRRLDLIYKVAYPLLLLLGGEACEDGATSS